MISLTSNARLVGFAGVLALLATPGVAAAGACPIPIIIPTVVTPQGASVPADGGILVADWLHGNSTGPGGNSYLIGPATGWRLMHGKRRTRPVVTTIAPGLQLIAGLGSQLIDGKRRRVTTVVRTSTPSPGIAAPDIDKVVFTRSNGRRSYLSVVVSVRVAPADGRFLVVFDKAGAVARSWGWVGGGATETVVYQAGECSVVPNGTVATGAADEVRLAWVDLTGHVSAMSAAITVTDASPPGPSLD